MDVIKCPKCKQSVTINISDAVDEEGETFQCPNCGYIFRYVGQ